MSGKRSIALLGASGYTGRLVARELTARGERPILIGRSRAKLEALRDALELELEIREADASDPHSIAAVLEPESVLATTAGPFSSTGLAAAKAALKNRCHYLDSAGEPGFHARLFNLHHWQAKDRGLALLTGFGTEWVLGNLAGALALEATPTARQLQVGYFLRNGERALPVTTLLRSFAGASLSSGISLLAEPGLRWSNRGLSVERMGRRQARLGDPDLIGLSIGGTEHLSLPRLFPELEQVDVFLGWFGRLTPLVRLATRPGSALLRHPPFARAARRLIERIGGSEPADQLGASGTTGSLTIARAINPDGTGTQVSLRGADLYLLTAHFLAWGAASAASVEPQTYGVVGPAEVFGLPALREAALAAGLADAFDQFGEPEG
jgi:hypothetical protein